MDDFQQDEEEVVAESQMEDLDPLCPIVSISMEERKEWYKSWKDCPIINLLGRRIGFKYLKARVEKLWNIKANLQFIDIGNSFYVV